MIEELKGHSDYVLNAVFSPDGEWIATAGQDGTARIWPVENERRAKELKGHSGPVNSVAFSFDSQFVATASDDATARVWEAATGQLVAELKRHADKVNSAVFDFDGQRLVTASEDQTAEVWELNPLLAASGLKGFGRPNYPLALDTKIGSQVVASKSDPLAVIQGRTEPANPNGIVSDSPRVARHELPWEVRWEMCQPQGGCGDLRTRGATSLRPMSPTLCSPGAARWDRRALPTIGAYGDFP